MKRLYGLWGCLLAGALIIVSLPAYADPATSSPSTYLSRAQAGAPLPTNVRDHLDHDVWSNDALGSHSLAPDGFVAYLPILMKNWGEANATPTATPTCWCLPTPTPTLRDTLTATPSVTPSTQASSTPSVTPSEETSGTPSRTRVPSNTPSITPSSTPTVRTSGTPSRTPTTSSTPTPSRTPTPSGPAWRQEAEDGILTPPMAIGADLQASAGRFISSAVRLEGLAEWTVHLPAGGDYYLWARAKGLDDWHNSFLVTIDDGDEFHYEVPFFNGQWTWGWDRVNAAYMPENPFPLAAGEHTLVFRAREEGARLDVLLLTDDPAFVPQ